MDSFNPEDAPPAFCIGQHESKRSGPVTAQVVQAAHESNYDMITSPITTQHFQSRVLGLLSSHLSNAQDVSFDSTGTLATSDNTQPLVIPPLAPEDTHLTPNESMSQLVGVTSSWIDMCSPDPLIADISRQVLMLEIAYAAFCGIGYVLIPGPKLHHRSMHSEGLVYYARAVQDAINVAPYLQFHIWLRTVDNPELEAEEMGDLAPFARMEFLEDWDDSNAPKVDPFGTWDAWDTIRRTCKYHSRLFVALSLPKHLPPMSVQSRWHSEPVHLLTVDANSFIKNQKGYPVLSKAHQALIARFMRLRTAPWILLCDVGPIPGVEAKDPSITAVSNMSGSEYPSLAQAAVGNKKYYDPTPHLSYMRNLQQRQPSRTAIERFGVGYQDYLQAPLQPLTVNLESITYEVFEKDPIKYEWYERAIAKALSDWSEQKKPTSNPDGRVVLAVVGAGRGPLVTRALKASAETGVDIDLWAVEKNPNAFVLLQRHNQNLWGGRVTLVQSDMRSWKGPKVQKKIASESQPPAPVGQSLGIDDSLLSSEADHGDSYQLTDTDVRPPSTELVPTTIDIVVSELLGSFGDNELSPECLDGISHLVNPVHGISIPASYTAHLTPIAAPKLHASVMNQTISNPAAPETPYVVMLHAIDYLSTNQPPASAFMSPSEGINYSNTIRSSFSTLPGAETQIPFVQTAWSFSHPNKHIPDQSAATSTIPNSHNARRTRLTFPIQNRGVCHGLAGYFETVLYRDVELSTNPVTMETKSANMISWFPIYFPLKVPEPDNGEVVVTMYRQTDDRKVWYEWMVEVYALERAVEPAAPEFIAPVMSGARAVSPDEDSGKSNDNSRSSPRKGRSSFGAVRRIRVGMSELHSSIKEGCLM
ncbi:PRMT5 arginine-N-methyltransferase-domain-containing protein [Aspergillus ambiguus]|uniref:protein arginine N-methyltransferase n=1 Tax=Aspergillus ambiguus TaxID=176160 RepID=UPI003CCCB973